jgi:hypothetical protein
VPKQYPAAKVGSQPQIRNAFWQRWWHPRELVSESQAIEYRERQTTHVHRHKQMALVGILHLKELGHTPTQVRTLKSFRKGISQSHQRAVSESTTDGRYDHRRPDPITLLCRDARMPDHLHRRSARKPLDIWV